MRRVLKWLTYEGGRDNAPIYVQWFNNMFSPNDFKGLDSMFACFIKYCANLNIVPSKSILEAYLRIDGMSDIKKYNVKVQDIQGYDYSELSQLMEATSTLNQLTISEYDAYMQEDLSSRDFKVDMYDFMSTIKSDSISVALMDTMTHMQDGSNVTELSNILRTKLLNIDKTYDTDKIKDVDFLSEDSAEEKMEFICDVGIPCIDADVGGSYTRMITTINAQPAGGKTRFAMVHWVYRTLTVAKKDVVVYELEMTKTQLKNILIAYHITQIYGGMIKIPDSLMNRADGLSEEQKQIYESAKIDLFESGKYGNLIIKEECVIETFRDECVALLTANRNVKLLVIDYMGLIESNPTEKFGKRLEMYQIITDAYITIRKIVRTMNVGAVCINQYNESGIDAAYAGKPIKAGYIQGGHIVHRHTDYNLDLTYTEEQKLAGVRGLAQSKSRGAAGFRGVLLQTDLAVSIFRQET